MMQQVEANNLVVRDPQGNQVILDQGKEAYFALMAQDMLQLADKHNKDIDEVHKIYYQVSCNRDKLIKFLNGDKAQNPWSELEDLALKESGGQMYNHVFKQKGEREVLDRKRFLEIN